MIRVRLSRMSWKAPFEELYGYVVMGSAAPNIGPINLHLYWAALLDPHFFPFTSHHLPHLYGFHESRGGIRSYYPSFEP